MKPINEYHDCDVFKPGEVWQSPRGYFWKVMDCVPGGQATLRQGLHGQGRIQRRGWDQIGYWVRDSAAYPDPTHTSEEN
jgi:hypothetical protein